MSRVSLASLRAGRSANIHLRAEWLHLLSNEIVKVDDLLRAVEEPRYKALRAITLRQLWLNTPKVNRGRAEGILNHILGVTGETVERRKMTIGWLLDPNSGGRRYQAWLDAQQSKKAPPWIGFPFTPTISGGQA